MTAHSILIVEDEHALGTALSFAVRRAGHLPTLVASGAAALDAVKKETFAAVVLDIGLPDVSGLRVLEKLRAKDAALPVLMITAHATLDHAISAQKLGATEYLTKPLDLRQFEQTLSALLAKGMPVEAPAPPTNAPQAVTLIGAAPCLHEVFLGIARACSGDVPALITGPSGSGKTLAASVIHAHGSRSSQAMIVADASRIKDAAGLDEVLKGAGKASRTTLLLEEVTLLSDDLQAKLAAWLANSSSRDLRLIATSSTDPRLAIEAGQFRAELYYALAALVISMPPLRERAGDITALCAFFLGLRGGAIPQLTPPALFALQGYQWPGNVRELRHVLDYAASLAKGGALLLSHLPPHVAASVKDGTAPPSGELDAAIARWLDQQLASGTDDPPPYDTLLDRAEAAMLAHLLVRYDNKPTHLAASLRMNRATLRQKLRRAGLAGEG